MNISIDELLKGKGTIIKEKEYFPTKDYVEPFLERMSKFTNDYIIRVKEADQLAKENDEEYKIYNRVWVQAVLPEEYAYENHKQSVSLLYALDTRKPIVKIFKGTVNCACLNLCTFNPEHLQVSELEPESAIDYRFITNVMEMTDNTKVMLEKLANTTLDNSMIYEQLGHWIDNCIKKKYTSNFGTVKITESTPIEVYKNIAVKEDSPYYSPDEHSYFDIYNAFTDIICNDKDKDLVNKFEKVSLVSKILDIM